MSFDYDEIQDKKHSNETQWAAYSDLFMVLAFIFLLMYMVSSLRTGMASVTSHAMIEEAKQELAMYKSTKENYLKGEASPEEQKLYKQVLGQIALLENEARDNKNRFAKQYNKQKEREQSLNQYQKLITTLVNANAIARADAVQTFTSKQQENKNLRREIRQKKNDIESLEDIISLEKTELFALKDSHEAETKNLEHKYQELKTRNNDTQENLASLNDTLNAEARDKAALKQAHIEETQSLKNKFNTLKEKHDRDQEILADLEHELTIKKDKVAGLIRSHSDEKSNMERKINRLKDTNNKYLNKVASLNEKLLEETREKRRVEDNLNEETENLKEKIQDIKRDRDRNKEAIASLEDKLDAVRNEKTDLKNTHYETKKNLQKKLSDLKNKNSGNQEKMASLENDLRDKEDEEDALKSSYQDAKTAMQAKIKKLKGEHDKNKSKLASLEDENRAKVAKLNSDLSNAQKNLRNTSDDLSKVKEDLADKSRDLNNAMQLEKRRRDLAKRIGDNFRNNGISADVDSKTGDVILDFGDNYFDTDSHKLKPGMKRSIRKAIPVYAQSLFSSEVLAPLISSVEIIGFASPTYAGKPVDPTELSAENRTAVNYNLDLSYRRARSIFEYVFDTEKIKFKHQTQMVHLINVTGRSFFTEKIDHRDTGGLTIDEFCRQYDCLKSQRVIIKFGLSDKGEA